MSRISPSFARTTSLMLSNNLRNQLQGTQTDLAEIQRQISTGQLYNKPSQGAEKAPAILHLRHLLATHEQHGRNLDHARSMLDNTDNALSDAHDLLLEAKSEAMGQIGAASDPETRKQIAETIDANIDGLLQIANRDFQGIPLFGGNAGARDQDPVFEEFLGGIRYRGSTDNLQINAGAMHDYAMNSNGLEPFGALSARVQSDTDLQPQLTDSTRLGTLEGASLEGIRQGHVRLAVNGQEVDVDLTNADRAEDVVARINDAIDSIGPGAGSLLIGDQGFTLNSNAGHDLAISDIRNGKAANDLGLNLAASNGSSEAGPSVQPRLTDTTRLADLGAGVDWTSGLEITQGEQTKTADFSGAETIQDLTNTINGLNLGLRLEINESGTGLDLVSEVSGVALSVGENGGSTASDLGLRSLGEDTRLDQFRDGLGVQTVQGENDLAFQLHDGTEFQVNLDGIETVQQLIDAVETAADNAGLNVGTDFQIDMPDTGNGLRFHDSTTGGADFAISSVGQSQAARHLGIHQNVGGDAIVDSGDQARVRVESVFTDLLDLSQSLRNDDETGIAVAGERLENDLDRLTQARAGVGTEARAVDQARERLEDREIAEKTMLSDLEDADLTEVITRFSQLQQQLQASLQVGAQNMRMSLLDFLR